MLGGYELDFWCWLSKVRVVEQVTLEEKLYGLRHRPYAGLLHTRIPDWFRGSIFRSSDADDYTMITYMLTFRVSYVFDLLDSS
jgi:hypothetical protein